MRLSPEETSFTYMTHYVCCCSDDLQDNACDCRFDGMVEVQANRVGFIGKGFTEGSGICPWCEVDFQFSDPDEG